MIISNNLRITRSLENKFFLISFRKLKSSRPPCWINDDNIKQFVNHKIFREQVFSYFFSQVEIVAASMRLLSLLSPPRAVPHFKEFMETAVKNAQFFSFHRRSPIQNKMSPGCSKSELICFNTIIRWFYGPNRGQDPRDLVYSHFSALS